MRLTLATAICLTIPALTAQADPVFVQHLQQGDRVEVKSSDPDTGSDTPFAIASVGKTFTAVAILRLVERGQVDIDAPAATYLPPAVTAGQSVLKGLTVRHLLTMSSGLPDYYTEDFFDAALADQATMQQAEAAWRSVADEPALFPAGTEFDYSNTAYLLLGLILEQVTGRDYAAVIAEEVLSPAGLTDSFVFGAQPLPPDFARDHPDRALLRRYYAGEGFGDGGLIASARDVARFYDALFNDGLLLSAQTRAMMLHDPFGQSYGMGIEIEDDIVGHSGFDVGYLADVRMNLATGAIAVMLVADENADLDWTYVVAD